MNISPRETNYLGACGNRLCETPTIAPMNALPNSDVIPSPDSNQTSPQCSNVVLITTSFALLLLAVPPVMVLGFVFPALHTMHLTAESMPEPLLRTTLLMHLYVYVFGLHAGLTGITVLGFSVDGARYRPSWLWWQMLCLGAVWLLYFPVGTALGVVLLAYSVGKRQAVG